ncbi:hypothetical protein, partial [Vibrio pectenicida]|uniref:hypothetical protein n=1 Tax=Vibrio pectenicida TaxID=62763 RepID=UPI00148E33F9
VEDHSTTFKQAETDSPSAAVSGKTAEQPTAVRGDSPDTVKSWPTVEPARGVIGSGANTGASYTGNNVHDKVRVSNYKLPIEIQRVLGQKSANKKLYMEKTGNVATAIQSRDMDRQVKLPYFNTSNQLASGSYKAYFPTLRKQNSYDELKEADNQQSEAPKLRIFGGNGFPRVDKNNFVQVSSHA